MQSKYNTNTFLEFINYDFIKNKNKGNVNNIDKKENIKIIDNKESINNIGNKENTKIIDNNEKINKIDNKEELNNSLFKQNEDGSVHMLRIVHMHRPFKITDSTKDPTEITVYDYDTKEKRKVKVDTLSEYSPLQPDGILKALLKVSSSVKTDVLTFINFKVTALAPSALQFLNINLMSLVAVILSKLKVISPSEVKAEHTSNMLIIVITLEVSQPDKSNVCKRIK